MSGSESGSVSGGVIVAVALSRHWNMALAEVQGLEEWREET